MFSIWVLLSTSRLIICCDSAATKALMRFLKSQLGSHFIYFCTTFMFSIWVLLRTQPIDSLLWGRGHQSTGKISHKVSSTVVFYPDLRIFMFYISVFLRKDWDIAFQKSARLWFYALLYFYLCTSLFVIMLCILILLRTQPVDCLMRRCSNKGAIIKKNICISKVLWGCGNKDNINISKKSARWSVCMLYFIF